MRIIRLTIRRFINLSSCTFMQFVYYVYHLSYRNNTVRTFQSNILADTVLDFLSLQYNIFIYIYPFKFFFVYVCIYRFHSLSQYSKYISQDFLQYAVVAEWYVVSGTIIIK